MNAVEWRLWFSFIFFTKTSLIKLPEGTNSSETFENIKCVRNFGLLMSFAAWLRLHLGLTGSSHRGLRQHFDLRSWSIQGRGLHCNIIWSLLFSSAVCGSDFFLPKKNYVSTLHHLKSAADIRLPPWKLTNIFMVPSQSINTPRVCARVRSTHTNPDTHTINPGLMKWKSLTGIKGLSPKDDDAGVPLVSTCESWRSRRSRGCARRGKSGGGARWERREKFQAWVAEFGGERQSSERRAALIRSVVAVANGVACFISADGACRCQGRAVVVDVVVYFAPIHHSFRLSYSSRCPWKLN